MQITQWGSLAFGANIAAGLDAEGLEVLSAEIDTQSSPDRYPDLMTLRGAQTTRRLIITRPAGSALTTAAWRNTVLRHFDPRDGVKWLYGTTQSGVAVQVQARAIRLERGSRREGHYYVDLAIGDPYWRSQSVPTATGTSVPTTGETVVWPVLTITPATVTAKRVRVTITDQGGYGLTNYWVRAQIDTSIYGGALTVNDFIVFWRGQKIPFYVQNINAANTWVDFRVDVARYQTTYVDIFFAAYLHNEVTPLTLDQTQISHNSASPNDANNTQMAWNNYSLSNAPAGPAFAWTPAKTGRTVDGVSTGLTVEGGSGATFSVRPDATLPNDVDSMVTCLGSAAASGNSFTGLTRIVTFPTVTNEAGYFLYTNPNVLYGLQGYINIGVGGVPMTQVVYNATAAEVKTAIATVLQTPDTNVSVTRTNPDGTGSGDPTLGYRWNWSLSGGMAGIASNLSFESGVDTFYYGVSPAILYRLAVSAALTSYAGAGLAKDSARAFVRYRAQNQVNWTDAWTKIDSGTVTAPINMGSGSQTAVWLAIGLEPLNENAYADLQLSGLTIMQLSASRRPSVSLSAHIDARIIAGTLTHNASERKITLSDVYFDAAAGGGGSVGLVIDSQNRRVYTSDGSMWYGDYSVSDPVNWLMLEVGANAFTADFYHYDVGGGSGHTAQTPTLGWAWREGYLV